MPWAAGKPTRGAWVFRNVTQAFDFWPMLETISISQLHPDGLAAMSCTVEDRNASLDFQNGDEMRVTFEGVRIWAGHIRVPGRASLSEHGPRSWVLTGQDFTAKLDDSVILTTEGERPRESIEDRVAWILTHLNYAITTANVNLPAGQVEPYDYDGSTVTQGLQQVSDEKGLFFHVNYEKDLHMFRTENIAAPFDISDTPDYSTTFPASTITYDEDDIEQTNAVRVKGLRHKTWRTDAASIAEPWGRLESAIIDDSLTTMEQVAAAGDRRLFQLAWPIVDGSFKCYEPGLRAGMTLHITDALLELDDDYILTEVQITAPNPHDASGKALLFQDVTFTDRRRIGRFPGSGKDIKEGNKPTGNGPGDGGGDPPGTCCNPVPTGPADLISWGDANIMGFEQGHTSGISHSITLPDGSGYPGGVVGGEIIDRQVLVFMMTVDELPGGGGGLDLMPSPWDNILGQVIGCTHGFFPFNNGHPNMQTKVFRLDVDFTPGELPETGATVVLASDDAIEVLWVSVLIGGTGGALTVGPSTTDWDQSDWSASLPATDVGNRALYFSIAYNRNWNNSEHGLGLSAEDHDTPVIGGLPADFARLTQAQGGEKTLNVDYAFSPVDTGAGLPTLSMTGYIGSSSGSQDFIITQLYGIEVRTTAAGQITPGPTWEGLNPLLYDGGDTPSYTITDGVVTITSDETGKVWAWYAIGPPDLPTSIGDWIISQRFNLDVAGSLTDPGDRSLKIAVDFDGKYLAAAVMFGDASRAQGVLIDGDSEVFAVKDIEEGEWHVFQMKWDGTRLWARFWLEADGDPGASNWDVETTTFQPALDPEADGLDRFYYSVSIGNDGGTPMVLVLPSPTIEGLALPGESVDWEIVGYGDGSETFFNTRYPYDELSLHVRIDGQMLGSGAFADLDGAGKFFELSSAPYGDPSDPTGSSVVEARYTRV